MRIVDNSLSWSIYTFMVRFKKNEEERIPVEERQQMGKVYSRMCES